MRRLLPLIALAAAGCSASGADPSSQLGPNPQLPAQNQYLLPPMHIAPVVGWNGAKPTVPAGFKIEPYATGFKNVRELYTLPNGDVLAVEPKGPKEPISRPKTIVMQWIEGFGHAKTQGANEITLLRDANGDGKPELRSVLVDHLASCWSAATCMSRIPTASSVSPTKRARPGSPPPARS
jgi:glucose/arabinose dehydrogenase